MGLRMKKRIQLVLLVLTTLTACGGEDKKEGIEKLESVKGLKSELDKLSSSQKNEVNKALSKVMKEKKEEQQKEQASAAEGKKVLEGLVASDTLLCKSNVMRKGYPNNIKTEKSVNYSGKSTPSLLDDSLYSVVSSHFHNSERKMRKGAPLEFVKYTKHILINAEGRYQWVENKADVIAKVKAMSSLQDGWSMKNVEKKLTPNFIPSSLIQEKYKNEERGRFLYAFKVWVENMLEKDDPTESIKNCSIPKSAPSMTPPELDYMTFEKIFEKRYSKSKDPKEHNIKMAQSELSKYRDVINFPPYVMYGSRPRYKPE